MLTTSIAWGHFNYETRMEFRGIAKQPIFGNAYLSAFLDNEGGKPKILPGQCRVVKSSLPEGLPNTKHRQFLEESSGHFRYYWNVDDPEEIESFKKRYRDGYNQQYLGMWSALSGGL